MINLIKKWKELNKKEKQLNDDYILLEQTGYYEEVGK
jgi:hypothetical protein